MLLLSMMKKENIWHSGGPFWRTVISINLLIESMITEPLLVGKEEVNKSGRTRFLGMDD